MAIKIGQRMFDFILKLSAFNYKKTRPQLCKGCGKRLEILREEDEAGVELLHLSCPDFTFSTREGRKHSYFVFKL